MTETTMPVAEAVTDALTAEPVAYEFAYHVLPTVAEGEVSRVSDELKHIITNAGGTIFDEEAAERFELAYEIKKYLEGKYRHFGSAYFGWIRFRMTPAALLSITEEIDSNKQLLRHLIIRLTKTEEANPFRFHESIADRKVTTIDTDAVEVADEDAVDPDADETAVVADDESVDEETKA